MPRQKVESQRAILSSFLAQDDLCSPLHVACVNSHYDMTKLLVFNGACVHDEDADGMTPILRLLIPRNSSLYKQRSQGYAIMDWGGGKVRSGIDCLAMCKHFSHFSVELSSICIYA